jgi:hypothetical protein
MVIFSLAKIKVFLSKQARDHKIFNIKRATLENFQHSVAVYIKFKEPKN